MHTWLTVTAPRRLTRAVGLPLLGAVAISAAAHAAADAAAAAPVAQVQAAQAAAQSSACTEARPFYWVIGDGQGVLAQGQVGNNGPTADTVMPIASASKWVYGAYVAERRAGQLSPQDIAFLHFQSGHTRFHGCLPFQSVGACAKRLRNGRGEPDPATTGRFDYNGGHMQQHAVLMGLGDKRPDELAQAVRQGLPSLGPDWVFDYGQAQPAGGGRSSAAAYGQFLQAVLRGELKIGALLGQHAVCTNPRTCSTAVSAPIPPQESWHYSIGHWVEDDPVVGDGAFSSPGAFGFYPWIDARRSHYGIVARVAMRHAGDEDVDLRPSIKSVSCGRAIRSAWAQASKPDRAP
jgi:hypothetical protein